MKHTKTKEQWYQDFMSHREAYGRKKPANEFTRCFLNWCMHTYPDEEYLTQEMLEVWGTKRNTEKVLSHGRRATAVNHFVEFINERGDGPYNLIEYEWGDPSPEPILASKAEMANFFKAVDELPTTGIKNNPLVDKMLLVIAIEAPVLFRMLYSTGIRVNEIRWLHRLRDRKTIQPNNQLLFFRIIHLCLRLQSQAGLPETRPSCQPESG